MNGPAKEEPKHSKQDSSIEHESDVRIRPGYVPYVSKTHRLVTEREISPWGAAKTFLAWAFLGFLLLIVSSTVRDGRFPRSENIRFAIGLSGLAWGLCYLIVRLTERAARWAVGGIKSQSLSRIYAAIVASVLLGTLSVYSPLPLLIRHYLLSENISPGFETKDLLRDFSQAVALGIWALFTVFVWLYRPLATKSSATRHSRVLVLVVAGSLLLVMMIVRGMYENHPQQTIGGLWLSYLVLSDLHPQWDREVVKFAPQLALLSAFAIPLFVVLLLLLNARTWGPDVSIRSPLGPIRPRVSISAALNALIHGALVVGAIACFSVGATATSPLETPRAMWLLFILFLVSFLVGRLSLAAFMLPQRARWQPSFYEHLALAVESGYPLSDAILSYLESDIPSSVKMALFQILHSIELGVSLPQALLENPVMFPAQDAALIASAEDPATLAQTLRYLANQERRRSYETLSLSYLRLIALEAIAAVIIFFFISIVSLPKILAVSTQATVIPIPQFSQAVFAASDWVTEHVLEILALLFLAYLLIRVIYSRSLIFRIIVWRLCPILKHYHWAKRLAGFSLGLRLQLQRGAHIAEGIKNAQAVVGDLVFSRLADRLADLVNLGNPLYVAVGSVRAFPASFAAFLALGARSERLPEVLELLAEDYQRQTTLLRERLLGIASILVALAVLILAVCYVMAVYLVMFRVVLGVPYE